MQHVSEMAEFAKVLQAMGHGDEIAYEFYGFTHTNGTMWGRNDRWYLTTFTGLYDIFECDAFPTLIKLAKRAKCDHTPISLIIQPQREGVAASSFPSRATKHPDFPLLQQQA